MLCSLFKSFLFLLFFLDLHIKEKKKKNFLKKQKTKNNHINPPSKFITYLIKTNKQNKTKQTQKQTERPNKEG
uniref:Secreted protein n=1 Tax=Phlebia radiata TaxID=5308 RepID=L8B965_PHLRA|nr:hypothetical protein PRA_mt0075 [Phlebia radiata]CCE89192.1 hypothetical protein PRA_mt0075 [Phlebia radiata]